MTLPNEVTRISKFLAQLTAKSGRQGLDLMFTIKKRRRTEVAVGQYGRTVSPVPCDWEVVRFYPDPEGISHVLLRQLEDPTNFKTIATELLLTETGYVLIQEAFEEPAEILDSA